jgi:hypothetical protein
VGFVARCSVLGFGHGLAWLIDIVGVLAFLFLLPTQRLGRLDLARDGILFSRAAEGSPHSGAEGHEVVLSCWRGRELESQVCLAECRASRGNLIEGAVELKLVRLCHDEDEWR